MEKIDYDCYGLKLVFAANRLGLPAVLSNWYDGRIHSVVFKVTLGEWEASYQITDEALATANSPRDVIEEAVNRLCVDFFRDTRYLERLELEIEQWKECPDCEGRGRIDDESGFVRTCEMCQGEGGWRD